MEVAASTVSVAWSLSPEYVPVTVCAPSCLAVQVLPLHDPSGAIEKFVSAVTLPIDPPSVSNASAVYDRDPPGWIVAFEGEITM